MSDSQQFVCIHGHFYQPPRENAWLEAIEVQDSAAPYHDWNARINHECYAANGASRILNGENRIARIVNNYSRISFNFGPTLLAWMEQAAPLTYRRILDADRVSRERFGGHGSAIAQVYNHVILPLAKTQDRETQIRWGIADFEARFGRRPEGMWLAETAVDLETLDLLAQHGILFTILAPHQCARVRAMAAGPEARAAAWRSTPGNDVDSTQPYRVRTGTGRSIAVFFYDGETSRAIAFEGLLNDGRTLATRLLRGFRNNDRPGQLVHVATDGESYGHHHRNGDMALAYALQWIEENSDVRLTNYGQFLEKFPPAFEAEIHENTSWSCAHGIDRWRADCGCGTGENAGWHQKWRAPLRHALDSLRDAVRPLWMRHAASYLKNPDAARDGYIQVLLGNSREAQQAFFKRYAAHEHDAGERTAILKLMEMERHIQLMYTSCGWFFEDLSGIETVQILSYAGRVVQLAIELFGPACARLERDFLVRLAKARGNAPGQPSGADIYRSTLASQKFSLDQVAARHAIVSLFENLPEKSEEYGYEIGSRSVEALPSGRGSFARGRVDVCSRITQERAQVDYVVLYPGDQSVSAAVHRTGKADGDRFHNSALEIRNVAMLGDLSEAKRVFARNFGSREYSLSSLFRDDQRRILKILLDSTLAEMEGTLRTIYRDHISLLRYLAATGMPKPQSLMLAAQFSLNADLQRTIKSAPLQADAIRQLLAEASGAQISFDTVSLSYLASQRMLTAMIDVQRERGIAEVEAAIELLDVLRELPFEVDLWEPQNRWYAISSNEIPGADGGEETSSRSFRDLGVKLGLEVDSLTVDS